MSAHNEFHIRRPAFALLTALLAWLAVGCGGANGGASITVFAASSLTDAFTDIAAEFEERYPGVEVKLNFAGSQRLRSQMELGADADVFAPADNLQLSLADKAGLLAGSGQPFAIAPMAVIAHSQSGIRQVGDLASEGVKLVLAHESVPAGQYARLLLHRLSVAGSGLGPDFGASVLENVVSDETSVKFVEQKVVLGQADAGVVYRPGALTAVATGSARELPLPPEAGGVIASYPIAVAKGSRYPEEAEMFVAFVLSPTARHILAEYGFDVP